MTENLTANRLATMVRTRFAPSPTGFMHIGNFRTGLFAWLVAKSSNGTFILRLEDTDKNREVKGSAKHILLCFEELGIKIDEGFGSTGKFGPYRQSDRLEIYTKWAQKLINDGRAYADPYSKEEVQKFREQAQKDKKPFLYRNHRPDNPPKWDGSQPLRFKSEVKSYNWHDEVMGELSTNAEVIDDFILIKSDGFPTYNFAHIIDDAEMQISHIIRGQEFLASMPNYLNLYEALELKVPKLAHLPHIMNEQGNKKLGKRDGAKDLLEYLKQGYLPEAMLSFIVTLGWNDGTEQEIFSRSDLIKKFSLSRVGKSGAQFDEKRLAWVNGYFIRQLQIDDLYKKVTNFWPSDAKDYDESYKKQVLGLVQERLKFFAELPELTDFFFTNLPINPELISNHKQLKKLDNGDIKTLLETAQASLLESDFSTDNLTNRLNALLTITHTKPAVLFSLIRIATTQSPASPGLTETLHVLGKEVSLKRLQDQIKNLTIAIPKTK